MTTIVHLFCWLIDWNRWGTRREMIRMEAIRLLSVCPRGDVDPSPSLQCLASDYSGPVRWQLVGFSDAMNQGEPLSKAMGRATGLFPDLLRQQIAWLEPNDEAVEIHLTGLVQRYDQNVAAESELEVGRGRFGRWSTFLASVCVLTFVFIFIVPTFEKMFDEFGLRLPWITLSVIAIGNLLAKYWFLFFLFATVVLRLFKRARSSSIMDRLVFQYLSPRRRREIRSARLRTLASLVESGSPPTSVISNQTFSSVREDEGKQIDWQPLVDSSWVTRREGELLSRLRTRRETLWCLNRIADHSDFLNDRKPAVLGTLVQIFGRLFYAVVVALVCISLYMPLVELIMGLT